MLLREPNPTAYDINFNLFGFPVRVHPGFFIISLLFGQNAISSGSSLGLNPGVTILVVIAGFFASILIHELGHAIAFRVFGQPARIQLYWMGGLAIPDGGAWSKRRSLTPNEHIIVSLAGPFLGLAFGGLLVGVVYAVGGFVEFIPPTLTGEYKNIFPQLVPRFSQEYLDNNASMVVFLWMGLYINIFWNLMNLVPVYPLDGGQVARELFRGFQGDPVRNSLMLSVFAGGLVAVLALQSKDMFIALLFGYLAYMSYMQLTSYGGGARW